jgi:uncharacterized protein (DUF608 family)
MDRKTRRRKPRLIYEKESLKAVSLPLGGIGAGQVALCGDGGLRQWQIFNNINHNAHVPLSFFAVRAAEENGSGQAKALLTSAHYGDDFPPAPSVSDHIVPPASTSLLDSLPGIEGIKFIGEYPVAEIEYLIPGFPLHLQLEAYSPFIPLNCDDSGLPAAIFHFTISNSTSKTIEASILMCQQNAVGWDDATEIDGIRHPEFGGNRNRAVRRPGLTAVRLANKSLPEDHPRGGEMLIAALSDEASSKAQWVDLEELWEDFRSDGHLEPSQRDRPSPKGQTLNAAIACTLAVEPGSEERITFLLTWRFPNKYADWYQSTFALESNIKKSKLWIGNHYASRFDSALVVAEYVRDNLERFDKAAWRFREAMFDSSLPTPIIDAVSSQISVLRSPTCFRDAEGTFYGFEGCLGASTEFQGDRGGCCPLNCTHVWNYAMTVARLFPRLERSMRETEWLRQQHDSGYLPHRVVVPFYLRRPWDRWIGGPPYPALDGLLGGVLKTYREFLACGDKAWLKSLWSHVRLAIDHVMDRYDRGDGVIHGPQPCTYDVEIEGPNSFIESLYLASLRAAEEMAKIVGDAESAEKYRDRFRLGRNAADRLLWDGEYYVHKYDPQSESDHAYGNGCHADQLFGQWWAHSLGLGHVFPPARVRRALSSIVKYNCRSDFSDHMQFPRRYVRDDEAGMLNCTWPKGEKPEMPLLYSDEVWTGIEYEAAGLLLYEGMIDEALQIIKTARKRHDGRLRSPWNDVECGDHYVRAMSSWTLLEAAAGYRYDASKDLIEFAPRIKPENFKCFFAAATGWGRYSQRIKDGGMTARLSVSWGEVIVRELRLACEPTGNVVAKIGAKRIPLSFRKTRNRVIIRFNEAVEIGADQSLKVSMG